MKKVLISIFLTICCLPAGFAQSSETLLLENWKFHRGQAEGAFAPEYDDSFWENVTVPHDWAISGPFDKDIDKQVVAIVQNGEMQATEKTGRTGSLPWTGEGWYRREIFIPEGYSHAELIFDGAMSEPKVWIDGRYAGEWANGYSVFSIDITSFTDGCAAGLHTLAVHLENIEESSRWYPGAGLYRPVRLLLHKERYLAANGTFARAASITGISEDAAKADSVRIYVTSEICADSTEGLEVRQSIMDADGRTLASVASGPHWSKISRQALTLTDAMLWSPERPVLYTLVTELWEGDRLWDSMQTPLGIREISFSSDGFRLNGQVRKIKGVCLHHDLGPLGTAFNKAAFRRQVRLLKEIGCDAIRTSHNAPAPWQMEICDSMGMMVMAESFDMWLYPKCANGYSRFFGQWWEKDITSLVLSSRNHPSVIMYSIGNEIPEQGSEEGLKYTRLMQELVHRLDGTRPCTQGMDQGEAPMNSGVWQEMDIPGFNYRLHVYQKGYEKSPKGFVLGTETASTVSSRGVYKFPAEEARGRAYDDGQISSYDLDACSWSNLPDDDWMWQDKLPWVLGEFVWTGFDYLGEPTPYDEYWPSRSSYFGIFDLAGLPKDRAFLYRTHWNSSENTLHILPHWTWKGREGENTPVFAYTTYPEAELFVNGRSRGRLRKQDLSMEEYLAGRVEVTVPWGDVYLVPDASAGRGSNRLDRYRLRWTDVDYEPGEIKVVAYDESGNAADSCTVRTAGKPHHIELSADRSTLSGTPVYSDGDAADTPDLAFVTVRIVDRDGNLCPDAADRLDFKVEGAASFKACCNGDATSTEVFVKPSMKAFHGQLVVIVQAGKQTGEAVLTVSGKGLGKARASLSVE